MIENNFSITLENDDSSDMGLYFSIEDMSPFLYRGITFASLKPNFIEYPAIHTNYS